MLIDLFVQTRSGQVPVTLSEKQRNEVLAAFPSSVQVRWNPDDFKRRPAGQLGLAIDTDVIAAVAAAGGALSAGFFGAIGQDAWQGIKRGLARLLRRHNDEQYSTNGKAYVLLNRSDGKTIALQSLGAVRPGESGKLSDDQIEKRLADTLDVYRASEVELGQLLDAANRPDKPVLLVSMINRQPTVTAVRSLRELDLPEQTSQIRQDID
jgi:hypothetical protein